MFEEVFSATTYQDWAFATCYFFGICLPLAASYGIWLVITNWQAPFIKKRQPYAQVLFIISVFVEGYNMMFVVILVYKLKHDRKWTWYLLVFVNIMMIAIFIIFVYRAWMLLYKTKLQRSFCDMAVDYIAEYDSNLKKLGTKRCSNVPLGNFWVRHRKWLGSPSKVSIFGLFLMISLSSLNIGLVWDQGFDVLLGSEFVSYDYLDMALSVLFVITCVILSIYSMRNTNDSFRFTLEVKMVMVLMITGLSLFWFFYRKAKYIEDADFRLTVSFNILQTTALCILLVVDWNLYKAREAFFLSEIEHESITIDEILKNEMMYRQFEEHLTSEFSLENLNFLKTCIYYYRLYTVSQELPKSSRTDHSSFRLTVNSVVIPEEQRMHWMKSLSMHKSATSVARYIFEEYCVIGAPQEINISRKIQRSLMQHFHKCRDASPAVNVFDNAYSCIVDLLTNDSLRRFKFKVTKDYHAI